ncbi:MAG: cytochrome C [Myxococcota bacterium]
MTSRPHRPIGPIRSWLLVCLLGGAVTPSGALGADLEALVMPGPVARAHEDIERDCRRCHGSFDRANENRLCLDCHEEAAADIRAHEGFHGRVLASEVEVSCRSCHTEHKGRDADILGFALTSFDHELTDFPLEGAHARASCAGCHEQGTPHREAASACNDCHGSVDPHSGRLGSDCGECHDVRSWTGGSFDHQSTDFALEGAHARVDCSLCHPNARYEGVGSSCASCHRGNDVHKGRFGAECEACHSVFAWERATFDHAVETGFELAGAHSEIRCARCHTGGSLEADLPSDCFGCHRNDDDHRGRNGEQCGDCHGSVSWTAVTFEHDRDTDFALEGAHAGLDCALCHRGAVEDDEPPGTCIGCHASEDAHAGSLGRDCQRCHGSSEWTPVARFDHGLTAFPLLGLHSVTSCEECHVGSRYKDTERDCSVCHADTAHEGRLGSTCDRCHTPNGWSFWQFDHDVETAFALHGAHTDLDCHACHTRPAGQRVRAATACVGCHAREDPHSGRLGRRCESCHRETRWEEVTR